MRVASGLTLGSGSVLGRHSAFAAFVGLVLYYDAAIGEIQ